METVWGTDRCFFTKVIEVTKLRYVRGRQVDICVVNYENFDNQSEFTKKIHSVPRQSCSDGIAGYTQI